jgi:hypothetical protein
MRFLRPYVSYQRQVNERGTQTIDELGGEVGDLRELLLEALGLDREAHGRIAELEAKIAAQSAALAELEAKRAAEDDR